MTDCSDSAHVLNLEHALSVDLHLVHLVSESSVNGVGRVSKVVRLWILVQSVRVRWLVTSGLCVAVQWENVRECVTHFQLAVESSVEFGVHIQTAIFLGSLGGWRHGKVGVLIGQVSLELVTSIDAHR